MIADICTSLIRGDEPLFERSNTLVNPLRLVPRFRLFFVTVNGCSSGKNRARLWRLFERAWKVLHLTHQRTRFFLPNRIQNDCGMRDPFDC